MANCMFSIVVKNGMCTVVLLSGSAIPAFCTQQQLVVFGCLHTNWDFFW